MENYTTWPQPTHLTKREAVRKEAFVMALQALAITGQKPTTQQVEEEAERFFQYLMKP